MGTELVATAAEKDGYTFTGWEVAGLPTDVDTTKATISFTMPANNVTLKAQYTENAPKTYKLDVTDAKVTLKDGSDVADLTAVRVGTELVATAAEKDGYTFTGWEVAGLPTDVDTTKATISFTMPANNVTLKAQYTENAPKTYKLDVSDATITLKDGGAVADLKAVPMGTELKATADEDTETRVFKNWNCTGLELTEEQRTAHEIYFTMPDHDVNLKAVFVTPTNKLDVSGAQVTLKDGGAVADLTAVPVGTELKATADEDTETSVFKNWNCTGLDLTEEQRTAHEIYFTMPDHDVNLVAEFVTPTKPDPAPENYKLIVSYAKVTLKDGSAVADLKAVPMGTELKATADEDTETSVFKNWNCTGLDLTEEQSTARVVYFTMPDHDVNLKAEFVTPTNKLEVTDAQVTLKDGGAVADLTAVPVGTELVATAPEKAGYTFDSWEKEGLPADANIDGATITFKMPANNVTLKAQYTENVPEKYTVTMGDETTEYAVGADVTIIAPAKAGETFTGWDAVGVPEGTDTNSETITFKMPANNVTLTPQYKKDSTPTPAPGGDSDGGGAAIVAVAAVGGAAIGAGAYIVGTTAYLKSVLPEGMAIPANRQQLAVALWTAAGKPATQSTALFNDVAADAAELQAIRWVVETGLMSAQDGSFKPGSRVGRMEVIRTWKTYQQRG